MENEEVKKEVVEEVNEEQIVQSPFKKDIVDSDVTLIGDKSTICQVV